VADVGERRDGHLASAVYYIPLEGSAKRGYYPPAVLCLNEENLQAPLAEQQEEPTDLTLVCRRGP